MADNESRLALRRALYRRLHWLWPLLASSRLRAVLRGLAWTGFALWLAFAALVLVLRYAVLPNVAHFQPQIETAIGQAIGQRVTIGRIEARWRGLNPDLVLDQMAIVNPQGEQVFALERVETVLSWHSLWRMRPILALLVIERPVLHVRRERDGRITVAGIETESEGDPAFTEWVLHQKRIRIRDATVVWEDRLRNAPPLALEDLQFGLDNRGRRHRFGITAAPPTDLAARIDLRGEVDGDLGEALADLSGRLFLQLDYADLAGWKAWVDYPVGLAQGHGALRAWVDFGEGLGRLTTDLALDAVRIRLGPKVPELDLQSLRGRLSGRYRVGAWRVAGNNVELQTGDGLRVPSTDFQLEWQQDQTSGKVTGTAGISFADLGVLSRLADFIPLDLRSRNLLGRFRPQGTLAELRASWSQLGDVPEQYALRAAFTGLGLQPEGYMPGAKGLSGQLDFNEKGGSLSIDSGASGLSLPAVFPEPDMAFDKLRVRANWQVSDKAVNVKLERLQFQGADATGSASGTYRYDGEGPGTIDLSGSITEADGRAVWRYMPRAVNADVATWLRRGIVAGRAHDAHLVLKGNLIDFPFRDPAKGKFLVTAKAEGVKLDYAEGWPQIDGIKADMNFGTGMRIVAERGRILEASLDDVIVEIPDFEAPEEMLLVRGAALGSTATFLDFIERSPVGASIDHFTRDMRAKGDGRLDLGLDIPLRDVMKTRVRGDYRFINNEVLVLDALPPIVRVNGRLAITENSIASPEITGRAFGGPVRVAIGSQSGRVEIQAAGTANVAEVTQHFGVPGRERLGGSAGWKAAIEIRHQLSGLRIESDLAGVSSSLPEPLTKAAGVPLPLRIERVPMEGEGDQFRIDAGEVVRGLLVRRGGRIERGSLVVGQGQAALPAQGVAIRVALPRVDADAWRAIFDHPGAERRQGPAMPSLAVIGVETPALRLFGREFSQVNSEIRPREDGWQIALNMQEAQGDLLWRKAGEGSLEGHLRRLVVRSAAETAGADTTAFNTLPGLDLKVDDFRIGSRQLGQLTLRARNEKGAWQLQTLNLQNPDGALTGRATWFNVPGEHRTRLDFELTANDVGKLLDRLGYPDAIRRGTATLGGDLQWHGPLTGIHYPTLTGRMAVSAANGQFNKLEPGVGRLLGLISLQSLPRRLTLDFRDIFSEGLAFDSIEGQTVVNAGVMRTVEPLRINSPAAQIEIQGEADLKNETQNLVVQVRPQIGAVAALGAALVNPIAGAAALVASTVLQNPLGRLFTYRYHVTGSWSDPRVEKVGESVQEVPVPTPKEGEGR